MRITTADTFRASALGVSIQATPSNRGIFLVAAVALICVVIARGR